jgi:hypothetical protein
MESVRAFHFRLYHDTGTLEITPGLAVDEVEGDVIRPDQISITFRGKLGGFSLESSMITLGDATYLTNPLTGTWEEGPTDLTPLGFFSPTEGIAAMTSQVSGPMLIASDASDGTYSIGGRLPAAALSPLIGTDILENAFVDLVLVIDSEQHYLMEARFTGRIVESDREDAARVIELSAFDQPISIEPPL